MCENKCTRVPRVLHHKGVNKGTKGSNSASP